MDKQKATSRKYGYLFVLIACYCLALTIFSCYTSPIFPNYHGYDSAIFSLIGKGLTEGKALYTELFDHKGPVIFLITALGHSIGGRGGIFFLQCIFGTISLCFCFHTGMLLRPEKRFSSLWECFAIFFAVYSVFFFTFQRGNLTEEYSLPFISASLYLFVRYAIRTDEKAEHSPWFALIHGINFGVLAFTRLNNAASVGMGVLAIAIFLIYRRKYANLLWNILFGISGLAVVACPILFYFIRHSSVNEMLYATFIHNFTIAGNTGHISFMEDPIKLFALYLPIVVCVCLMLRSIKSPKELRFMDVLLIAILGINVLSLLLANRFPHYFTVFSPVYAMFLCRYFFGDNRKKQIALIAFCTCMNLALACYFSLSSINDVYINQSATIRNDIIHADAKRIPEDEKDSVIGFKLSAGDYLSSDIIPCYRYYTLQDTWAITNPSIMVEFMEWIEQEKPVWVLINSDEDDPAIFSLLDAHYQFQFSNEYISFFRLKEAGT